MTYPSELVPQDEVEDEELHLTHTLMQRNARYGNFLDQANVSCGLKLVMKNTRNWNRLRPDQQEALEMIAVKISRILMGDPDYIDNWHDIEGYARLVKRRLQAEQSQP